MSRESRPPRQGGDSNWKAIAGVAAGIMLIWFIITNAQQVEVTWWVFDTSTSLIVVILISALLGAGVTYFLTRVRNRQSRRPIDAEPRGGERP